MKSLKYKRWGWRLGWVYSSCSPAWQECAIEIDWTRDDPSVQIPETPGERLCKGIALPHSIGLKAVYTLALMVFIYISSDCALFSEIDSWAWSCDKNKLSSLTISTDSRMRQFISKNKISMIVMGPSSEWPNTAVRSFFWLLWKALIHPVCMMSVCDWQAFSTCEAVTISNNAVCKRGEDGRDRQGTKE